MRHRRVVRHLLDHDDRAFVRHENRNMYSVVDPDYSIGRVDNACPCQSRGHGGDEPGG